MSFFSPEGEDRHHSQPCVPGTVPLFLLHDSFTWFTWFLLHDSLPWSSLLIHSLTNTLLNSEGIHYTSLRFSLSSDPLSDVLSHRLKLLQSPWTLSSISSTREVCWTLLQDHNLGTLFRRWAGQLQGSHNLLPISQESLSLPVLFPGSWKPLVHAFHLFFIVSGGRVSPVFFTPRQLEAASGHQVHN